MMCLKGGGGKGTGLTLKMSGFYKIKGKMDCNKHYAKIDIGVSMCIWMKNYETTICIYCTWIIK